MAHLVRNTFEDRAGAGGMAEPGVGGVNHVPSADLVNHVSRVIKRGAARLASGRI